MAEDQSTQLQELASQAKGINRNSLSLKVDSIRQKIGGLIPNANRLKSLYRL